MENVVACSRILHTRVLLQHFGIAVMLYVAVMSGPCGVHQTMAWVNIGISVRVVYGKRIGVASTNAFDTKSLKDVVKRAETLAKLQDDDPEFQSLPGPEAIAEVNEHVFKATE